MNMRKNLAEEIISKIIAEDLSKEEIQSLKTKLASKYGIEIPGNGYLFSVAQKMGVDEKLLEKLKRKPTRTLSGVTIVAVMTSPKPCPHGICVYCPQNPNVPQSYADNEPAVMRGKALNFDPYEQTKTRIKQLEAIGHPTDKIELIVMGGTFTARREEYQRWFVKRCYDSMNGENSRNLEEAKSKNERAKHRCTGLTIETRPDYMKERHINEILELGATRVELGVQNPDDRIYKITKRGHTIKDVIESTRLLKDSGFKICYHLMPNLPGSTLEKDFKMFKKIFENENYKPDMIKIYPTLVVKNAELEKWWREGKFEPYTDEELIDLLCRVKSIVPKYVRIMRLQRDVPRQEIVAGCKYSNLREIVQREMKKRGLTCRCIRCREVGHRLKNGWKIGNFVLKVEKYRASKGKEYFLIYEDENETLAGILRLRIPYKPFRIELENSAIIRELHVYGPEVPIGGRGRIQHTGLGENLLKEAERIARDEGMEKLAIISGVGVREYYRKFGYSLEGPYMTKNLSKKL
ncbi:MAG: tRNA uridine(34) 5-carboxymethylaminomethyl modification radical SAM/GNAT enzyme Elp3 [Candidatus Aenigmarchaeota archaeon]|nr:tRNA uridine(34) 5-carboxymethylaminomethyl modification radical SAM/GNAT enzyme Elp3 [Candidatus Aenigmarchaeota archaeon]